VDCRQIKLHGAKGKKTKSNKFKMLKTVHKSKPKKFHGEKLICGGHTGHRNVEESSRRRRTMVGNGYNLVPIPVPVFLLLQY